MIDNVTINIKSFIIKKRKQNENMENPQIDCYTVDKLIKLKKGNKNIQSIPIM